VWSTRVPRDVRFPLKERQERRQGERLKLEQFAHSRTPAPAWALARVALSGGEDSQDFGNELEPTQDWVAPTLDGIKTAVQTLETHKRGFAVNDENMHGIDGEAPPPL
jgi:hypothetical protein